MSNIDLPDNVAEGKLGIFNRMRDGSANSLNVINSIMHRAILYHGYTTLPSHELTPCYIQGGQYDELHKSLISMPSWGTSLISFLQDAGQNIYFKNIPSIRPLRAEFTQTPILQEYDSELDSPISIDLLINTLDQYELHYVEELFPHPSLADPYQQQIFFDQLLNLIPAVASFFNRIILKWRHTDISHGTYVLAPAHIFRISRHSPIYECKHFYVDSDVVSLSSRIWTLSPDHSCIETDPLTYNDLHLTQLVSGSSMSITRFIASPEYHNRQFIDKWAILCPQIAYVPTSVELIPPRAPLTMRTPPALTDINLLNPITEVYIDGSFSPISPCLEFPTSIEPATIGVGIIVSTGHDGPLTPWLERNVYSFHASMSMNNSSSYDSEVLAATLIAGISSSAFPKHAITDCMSLRNTLTTISQTMYRQTFDPSDHENGLNIGLSRCGQFTHQCMKSIANQSNCLSFTWQKSHVSKPTSIHECGNYLADLAAKGTISDAVHRSTILQSFAATLIHQELDITNLFPQQHDDIIIASINDSSILFTGTPSTIRKQVCSKRASSYLASRGNNNILSIFNWYDLAWNVQGTAMQSTLRTHPELYHFAYNLLYGKLWNNLFKYKASFAKYINNFETKEDFYEAYPPPNCPFCDHVDTICHTICACEGLHHGVPLFDNIREKTTSLLKSYTSIKNPIITSMVLRMAEYLESNISRDSRTWAGLFPLDFINSLIGRYCYNLPTRKSFQLCVAATSAFQNITLQYAKSIWILYNAATHVRNPLPRHESNNIPGSPVHLPPPANRRRKKRQRQPTNTINNYFDLTPMEPVTQYSQPRNPPQAILRVANAANAPISSQSEWTTVLPRNSRQQHITPSPPTSPLRRRKTYRICDSPPAPGSYLALPVDPLPLSVVEFSNPTRLSQTTITKFFGAAAAASSLTLSHDGISQAADVITIPLSINLNKNSLTASSNNITGGKHHKRNHQTTSKNIVISKSQNNASGSSSHYFSSSSSSSSSGSSFSSISSSSSTAPYSCTVINSIPSVPLNSSPLPSCQSIAIPHHHRPPLSSRSLPSASKPLPSLFPTTSAASPSTPSLAPLSNHCDTVVSIFPSSDASSSFPLCLGPGRIHTSARLSSSHPCILSSSGTATEDPIVDLPP